MALKKFHRRSVFEFGLNFSVFRPGARGPFVSAKGPKTMLVLAWPFDMAQALRVPCAVRRLLRPCSGQVWRRRKLAMLRQCALRLSAVGCRALATAKAIEIQKVSINF